MLPDQCGVICMSTIDWEFSWQPNQEIMYRLAAAGTPVLYVETTGLRSIRFSDWPRVLTRLQTALLRAKPAQRTHPNLTIYSPLVLPFPHLSVAHALNTQVIFRVVDRWIRTAAVSEIVLWAFLASPMTLAVINHIQPAVVVFQLMGDVRAHWPVPAIAEAERGLLRRADLVFTNSIRLLGYARGYTPQAHLFRAAVDVDAFARAAEEEDDPPPEFALMSRPIAGYIGSVHSWLDLDLLDEVASRLPSWEFAMIGVVLRDLGHLGTRANVHWLGQRPHHELARYVRHFDVGLIPYVLDEYTASAYPGKLHEYFALGKPVVATPLPELAAYNDEFGDVVRLAAGPDAFAQALEAARAQTSAAQADQYRAVARANSWDVQMRAMTRLITEALWKRRS